MSTYYEYEPHEVYNSYNSACTLGCIENVKIIKCHPNLDKEVFLIGCFQKSRSKKVK